MWMFPGLPSALAGSPSELMLTVFLVLGSHLLLEKDLPGEVLPPPNLNCAHQRKLLWATDIYHLGCHRLDLESLCLVCSVFTLPVGVLSPGKWENDSLPFLLG